MVVEAIVTAVWAMLPAYVPNNVAVLVGGGRPIDGGRTWRGHRLLGDGKTVRGTAAGVVAGVVAALLMNRLRPESLLGTTPPEFPISVAVGLAGGAMLGDVVASFAKRRTGSERGAAFPLVDQLDFVAGALLLAAGVHLDWFFGTFTAPVVLVVVVLTPLLHVLTNWIAYLLDLKTEPW